jgi:hypothetical protein
MEACCSRGAAGSFEGVVGGDGVDVANGAEASVPGEDLVAEVAGVGAETPLVYAVVGAEGAAPFGENFEIAPAAERQVVGAEWQGRAGGVASGESAGNDHAGLRIEFESDVWG